MDAGQTDKDKTESTAAKGGISEVQSGPASAPASERVYRI
jgi:hypothetical protein